MESSRQGSDFGLCRQISESNLNITAFCPFAIQVLFCYTNSIDAQPRQRCFLNFFIS